MDVESPIWGIVLPPAISGRLTPEKGSELIQSLMNLLDHLYSHVYFQTWYCRKNLVWGISGKFY